MSRLHSLPRVLFLFIVSLSLIAPSVIAQQAPPDAPMPITDRADLPDAQAASGGLPPAAPGPLPTPPPRPDAPAQRGQPTVTPPVLVSQELTGAFYRVRVLLPGAVQRQRFEALGLQVLSQQSANADVLAVLVTSAQLEQLVSLGFRTQDAQELTQLVNTAAASGLAATLNAAFAQGRLEATSANSPGQVNLSSQHLAEIAAIGGVDSDGDGLSDTAEGWWCTDPNNPDSDGLGTPDGVEVEALKDWRYHRTAGPPDGPDGGAPFANWPDNLPNCADLDKDSIPDAAERWELGLSATRETTDRDRYDDGQELFGITYCPGGATSCNYGSYPRSDDGFISSEMPPIVQAPGHHPLMAAMAEPEIRIVPAADGQTFRINIVNQITTSEGTIAQRETSYETAVSEGVETRVEETRTWDEWQEVAQAVETIDADPTETTETVAFVVGMAPDGVSVNWRKVGAGALKVAGGVVGTAAACTSSLVTGPAAPVVCGVVGGAAAGFAFDGVGDVIDGFIEPDAPPEEAPTVTPDEAQMSIAPRQYTPAQHGRIPPPRPQRPSPTVINFDTSGIVRGLEANTLAIQANGQAIQQGLIEVTEVLSAPRRTETTSSGSTQGGAQATSTAEYQEHQITTGERIANAQTWETAVTTNSAHAADLSFSFELCNVGTDYLRVVENILFNIYVDGESTPTLTHTVEGPFDNLQPMADDCPTLNRVLQLSLAQLIDIDTAQTVRIEVENVAYGDDQIIVNNVLEDSLRIGLDDGIADGDQNLDYYFLPVYGAQASVLDVMANYFPYEVDTTGNLNALWTPEPYTGSLPTWCDQPRVVGETLWCRHALSTAQWWTVYTSGMGADSSGFHEVAPQPGSSAVFRFFTDSDGDGYSDVSEADIGTDPNNPTDFPQAQLLAAVHTQAVGDERILTLALDNPGLQDAVGVQAVLFAPDDSITITDNVVGGNGRVRANSTVVVGSRIYPPTGRYANNSTARVGIAGYYEGLQDAAYTLRIHCGSAGGCAVGNSTLTADWSDEQGNSGSLSFGNGYTAGDVLPLAAGVQVFATQGVLYDGDTVAISAEANQDAFRYTVNNPDAYTPPIVLVSYNDPRGNHQFVTPVTLESPNDDLLPYRDGMLGNVQMQPVTTGAVQAGANTLRLSTNNPTAHSIRGANLYLNFYDEAGNSVLAVNETVDLPPGPSVTPIAWNTNDFNQPYDPSTNYLMVAYWTDYANTIIDSTARYLDNFQVDPQPQLAASLAGLSLDAGAQSNADIDLGSVPQGSLIQQTITLANSGDTLLLTHIGEQPGIRVEPIAETDLQPGDLAQYRLIIDTSEWPLGAFQRTLPLRTNEPDAPQRSIQVHGMVVTPPQMPSAWVPDGWQASWVDCNDYGNHYTGVGLFDQPNCSPNAYRQHFSNSGFYNMTTYNFNDQALSVHVSRGWSVRVYEHTDRLGRSACLPEGSKWNLNFDSYDQGGSLGSDISSIEVYREANCGQNTTPDVDLSADLRNVPSTVQQGQEISYEIRIRNEGNDNASGGQLSHTINNDSEIIRVPNGCNISANRQSVSCNVSSLSAGSRYTYDISARIGSSATGTVRLTAEVNANEEDQDPRNDSDSDTLNIWVAADDVDLDVNVGAPSTYMPGETFTYNVTVDSEGTSPSSPGTLTHEVSGPVASFEPVSGECTIPSATRATCTVPALDARGGSNDSRIYPFRVQPAPDASTNIELTATIESSDDDSNPGNNTDTDSVQAQPNQMDLSLSLTNAPESVRPGTDFTFDVIATNAGPQTATNAEVELFLLVDGLEPVNLPADCSPYLNTVICNLAQIAAGGTASQTLTMRTDAEATTEAFDLSATIRGTGNDTNPHNNEAWLSVPVQNLLSTQRFFRLAADDYAEVTLMLDFVFDDLALPVDIADAQVNIAGQVLSLAAWQLVSQPGADRLRYVSPDVSAQVNAYLDGKVGNTHVPLTIAHPPGVTPDLHSFEALPSTQPDLQVQPSDITLSNPNPVEAESVTATVTVSNLSTQASGDTTVLLYAEDDGVYNLVGSDHIPNVSAGASAQASITWDTTFYGEQVQLYAEVDAYDRLPETNETNNVASVPVSLRTRPDVLISQLALTDGLIVDDETEVQLVLNNAGQLSADDMRLALYVGDPADGGLLVASQTVTVPAESSDTVTLNWLPTAIGSQTVYAVVDADNVVSESNERNNIKLQTVYVGFSIPRDVDSGNSASDLPYDPVRGYGYLNGEANTVCGSTPELTHRTDANGELRYRFDQLASGRYYRLDMQFRTCDGLTRMLDVLVDNNVTDLSLALASDETRTVSLLLDPAYYADDHSVVVAIQTQGIADAVISRISLHDVDYRYIDAGASDEALDPPYTAARGYGYLNTTSIPRADLGPLAIQTMRRDFNSNMLTYRFDNLKPATYQLSLAVSDTPGTTSQQEVLIDGQATGVLLTLTSSDNTQRQQFTLPYDAYRDDGSIEVSIRREDVSTNAFVNELALQEIAPNPPNEPECLSEDMDCNGAVTPSDAMFVIMHIGTLVTPQTPQDVVRADIDANGAITPGDAMAVILSIGQTTQINAIAQQHTSDAPSIHFDIVELDRTPGLRVGESFNLNVYMQDAEGRGLFSGFVDLAFPVERLRVDGVRYAETFSVAQSGQIENTQGMVRDLGAVSRRLVPSTEPEALLVAIVRMTALAQGDASVRATASSGLYSEIVTYRSAEDVRSALQPVALNLSIAPSLEPTRPLAPLPVLPQRDGMSRSDAPILPVVPQPTQTPLPSLPVGQR